MVSEGILGQIIAQGFGGLLTNLATSYVNRAGREIKQDQDTLKRDLTDHLQVTFNKCMKVKTILNSERASETLEIYVDQSFRQGSKIIDQYSMIDTIRAGNSTIIIGEGGGGKSMFMRYLWLSYFERSEGRIPFFLELRNINGLTHASIVDFIFHSIIKSGSTIRQIDFTNALKSGEFILFLDGFDEINFDRRDSVQKMILELQENNPRLTIVLTSRSDERFIGWDNFATAHVQPLSMESSRLLIERADYSKELKNKFISKFDKLFGLHKDFLSNPLLAYMMLVTFSYNPDIPRRMFQFYEQAFEALYHRHDLTKGYKREFHCSLDKVDFMRLTAYFCLKTYYDEKIEFSRSEILEAIEKAKEIEGISASSEDFLSDLTQSVCLMKLEGLTYTFTHRSFQEYFSAYCIARVAIRDIEKLFSRFSKRHSDGVLPMVSDINADLFREKYIVPNAKKFGSYINRESGTKLYENFASRIGAVFTIRQIKRENPAKNAKNTKHHTSIFLEYHGDMADFFRVVFSVVENQGITESTVDSRNDEIFGEISEKLLGDKLLPVYIFVERGIIRFSSSKELSKNTISSAQEAVLREKFKDTRMYDFIVSRARLFLEFVRDEVTRYNRVSGAFADLF